MQSMGTFLATLSEFGDISVIACRVWRRFWQPWLRLDIFLVTLADFGHISGILADFLATLAEFGDVSGNPGRVWRRFWQPWQSLDTFLATLAVICPKLYILALGLPKSPTFPVLEH